MPDESIALLRLREQSQADANTITKLRENLERALAERDAARAACAVKDAELTNWRDKLQSILNENGVFTLEEANDWTTVHAALSSDGQPILDELTRLRSERAESRAACSKLESRLLSEVEERQQVRIEAATLRAQVADLKRERDEARLLVEDATRQSGRSVAEGKSLVSIVWSLKKSFDELTRETAELRKDRERWDKAESLGMRIEYSEGWSRPWSARVAGRSMVASTLRAAIDYAISPETKEEDADDRTNCCDALFFDPGFPECDICSECKEHAEPHRRIDAALAPKEGSAEG